MRFKQFLLEDENDIDKLIDYIKSNCKQFVENVISENNLMYRGSKTIENKSTLFGLVYEVTPRKDRKSKDSADWIHELLNNYFVKHFSIKARSETVFVSKDQSTSSEYGPNYLVIPIGKYSVIYSKYVSDAISLDDGIFSLIYTNEFRSATLEILINYAEKNNWGEDAKYAFKEMLKDDDKSFNIHLKDFYREKGKITGDEDEVEQEIADKAMNAYYKYRILDKKEILEIFLDKYGDKLYEKSDELKHKTHEGMLICDKYLAVSAKMKIELDGVRVNLIDEIINRLI